jgi:IS5 family transposase
MTFNWPSLTAWVTYLLVVGRYAYQKLMVVSELVRQSNILYHSETRSIPDRILSLWKLTSGRLFVGRRGPTLILAQRFQSLALEKNSPPMIGLVLIHTMEGEDLKAQARAYRPRHANYSTLITENQIYRLRSNRVFFQRHGIRLCGPRLGCHKRDPEMVDAEK